MTPTTFSLSPSPVGELLLLHSTDGLLGLDVLHDPLGPALEGWSRLLGAAPTPDDERAAATVAELDAYFDGRLTAFTVPIDWTLVGGFTRSALQAVCEIPYGETASYADVAAMAGSPRAHRAVGTACARTPISVVVPVHRVVRADGSIGEYGGHPEVKQALIDLESRSPGGV